MDGSHVSRAEQFQISEVPARRPWVGADASERDGSRPSARCSDLSALTADMEADYRLARNFRWRTGGCELRKHHVLSDDRGAPVLAIVDVIVEPVTKRGARAFRSVTHVVRLERVEAADPQSEIVSATVLDLRTDDPRLVC